MLIEDPPTNSTHPIALAFQVCDSAVSNEKLGRSDGIDEPKAINTANGFVSRSIRVLRQLVSVAYPWISHIATDEGIQMQVEGCINAQLDFKLGARSYLLQVTGTLG